MLKRTPLFAEHQRLGGRLVEFGGWEMPVQYTGIADEHLAVRAAAGLFDISHMGEFSVGGPGATAFLDHMLVNDVRRLAVGEGQYTLLCNARGGVIDDLYLYRLQPDEYLLIVNAARIAADWEWLHSRIEYAPGRDGLRLRDASDELGAIAIQGPKVVHFLEAVVPNGSMGGTLVSRVTDLRKNQIAVFPLEGALVYVARTGYTGEDGFELVAPAAVMTRLWQRALEAGSAVGLKPAGLGARDTLRTEMCYPLYGHELDEQTTPLEAGLGYFVALDKGDFIGRTALVTQKAQGLTRRCVPFKMTERSAPPRPGYPVWSAENASGPVGRVSSGTPSPSLGTGVGLAYVPVHLARPGTPIAIEIRDRRSPAQVAAKPLYRPLKSH